MARVLLGVTGGIAAYKACELCRLLVRAGHEVTPVLTPDAERFVTAHTFEALARRESPRDLYPHLVDADLLVIAPLSANTLAAYRDRGSFPGADAAFARALALPFAATMTEDEVDRVATALLRYA